MCSLFLSEMESTELQSVTVEIRCLNFTHSLSFNNSHHHWLVAGWIGFSFSQSYLIFSLYHCAKKSCGVFSVMNIRDVFPSGKVSRTESVDCYGKMAI